MQSDTRILCKANVGLLLIATLAVLYLAADLLKPIAFAVLLNLLLSPVVRAMQRRGIAPAITAVVLVAAIVSLTTLIVSSLAEPAERWLADAPTSIRELQRDPAFTAGEGFENIQELAEEVEQLASSEPAAEVQAVIVRGPGVLESFVGGLPSVVGFVGIVVFLTYFLLASGDTLLRRMTQCGRTWGERRRVVSIVRQLQTDLSRYLATVTAINLVLGSAVALAMYFLEVPNPVLWGAMVALFNFAPYIGALASAAVLTLVGLMTFENLTDAFSVPGVFLILTIAEGQLITPMVLGRRLSLSPLFVFLAVVLWGWLWGIAGALMAVPIVTSLKVVLDHIPSLEPLGRFIRSDRDLPARQILAKDVSGKDDQAQLKLKLGA